MNILGNFAEQAIVVSDHARIILYNMLLFGGFDILFCARIIKVYLLMSFGQLDESSGTSLI